MNFYYYGIIDIIFHYNEEMWDLSERALNGDKGVWTHVSFRKPSDKQDCHPDPNLISMLRTIASLV